MEMEDFNEIWTQESRNFVIEEFYESFSAPKWFDLSLLRNPKRKMENDDSSWWFCSRHGCDMKHSSLKKQSVSVPHENIPKIKKTIATSRSNQHMASVPTIKSNLTKISKPQGVPSPALNVKNKLTKVSKPSGVPSCAANTKNRLTKSAGVQLYSAKKIEKKEPAPILKSESSTTPFPPKKIFSKITPSRLNRVGPLSSCPSQKNNAIKNSRNLEGILTKKNKNLENRDPNSFASSQSSKSTATCSNKVGCPSMLKASSIRNKTFQSTKLKKQPCRADLEKQPCRADLVEIKKILVSSKLNENIPMENLELKEELQCSEEKHQFQRLENKGLVPSNSIENKPLEVQEKELQVGEEKENFKGLENQRELRVLVSDYNSLLPRSPDEQSDHVVDMEIEISEQDTVESVLYGYASHVTGRHGLIRESANQSSVSAESDSCESINCQAAETKFCQTSSKDSVMGSDIKEESHASNETLSKRGSNDVDLQVSCPKEKVLVEKAKKFQKGDRNDLKYKLRRKSVTCNKIQAHELTQQNTRGKKKLTSPKPFRLRTEERAVSKETKLTEQTSPVFNSVRPFSKLQHKVKNKQLKPSESHNTVSKATIVANRSRDRKIRIRTTNHQIPQNSKLQEKEITISDSATPPSLVENISTLVHQPAKMPSCHRHFQPMRLTKKFTVIRERHSSSNS